MGNFTYSMGLVISPKDPDDILVKTLNSIINQTQKPDEIIILKNGQLNIFKIKLLEEFSKVVSVDTLLLESKTALDFAQALNLVIENTKCDYLIRQDPDDICVRNRVEIIKKEIDKNEYDLFHSSTLEFNRKSRTVLQKKIPKSFNEIRESLIYLNPILHSTVVISTKLLKNHGGYETALLAEDYLLWLKIFQSKVKVGYFENPLVVFDSTNKFKKRSSKILFRTELKIFKYKISIKFNSFLSFASLVIRLGYIFMPNLIKKLIDERNIFPHDTKFVDEIEELNSIPLRKEDIIKKISIDVIIPNFNREKELNEAIRSVTKQTISNQIQIIVIDDQSNFDVTIEPILKSTSKIHELKNTLRSGGPAVPRNIGLDFSKADLIAFLDSDDLWSPEHLENALKYTPFGISYAQNINNVSDTNFTLRKLIKNNLIITSSVVISKDLKEKIGFFPYSSSHSIYEDYAYWLRSTLFQDFYLNGTNLIEYSENSRDSYRKSYNRDFICLFYTFQNLCSYASDSNKKIDFFAKVSIFYRIIKSFVISLFYFFRK